MAGDVMWGDRLPGLSEGGQIRTSHSSNFDFAIVESHSLQSLRLVEKEEEATFTGGIALSGGDLHQVFFSIVQLHACVA